MITGRGLGLGMIAAAAALALCGAAAGATQFQEINSTLGLPGTSGAAWGDYDGDGFPDLYLAGSPPFYLNRPDQLFRNNAGQGHLTFTDVSAAVGLSTAVEEDQGVAWGDYDNDGFLDVIIGSGGALTKLYDNEDGIFQERATAAGLNVAPRSGRTVAWCDYDGDNWLDVFVCYALTNVSALFHNNHDGTFTEVTESAGMTSPVPPTAGNDCSWADYDNDGHPDLILSRGSMDTPQSPLLYHNKGDGTFEEVAAAAGLGGVADTLGVAWLDYDNDGFFDLYLCGERHGPDWLFHNNGDGTFTETTVSAGMGGDPYVGNSVACADYDNDGYEDIFVGNTEVNEPFLYHNNGNGTFTDVAVASGLGGSRSNLVAIRGDMDVDGRMDLFVGVGEPTSRLYHNVGQIGTWLRVRALTSAAGDATDPDAPTRDAIGAVVSVNLDSDPAVPAESVRTLMRTIDGGGGYQGQHEPIAQFGLGGSSLVSVRVRFPDGSVVVHRGEQVNRQLVIRDVPADRVEIFDDVPLDYWAYPAIAAALDAGIVQGYWDNTYRPAGEVDRASMAVYLARALAGGDEAVADPSGDTPSFTDVGTDHWAYKYIEYAASPEANVVQGYPGGNYKPDDLVNRGQMAVYIARAMVTPSGDAGVPDPPAGDPTFSDVTAAGDWSWCYNHVEYLAAEDIVQGYWDGTYRPDQVVTRDQMAVYIARAFDLPL
jgi:hypothetical protein